MKDLLDLVPDSVLISSKIKVDEEENSPTLKGLFANFKMNQFFGGNLISIDKKSGKKHKKTTSKDQIVKLE